MVIDVECVAEGDQFKTEGVGGKRVRTVAETLFPQLHRTRGLRNWYCVHLCQQLELEQKSSKINISKKTEDGPRICPRKFLTSSFIAQCIMVVNEISFAE